MANITRVDDPRAPGGSFLFDIDTGQPVAIGGNTPNVPPEAIADAQAKYPPGSTLPTGGQATQGTIQQGTALPSVVNGRDAKAVNSVLQGIPGHEKWTVTGQPTVGQDGNLTWYVTGPTGESDQIVVNASGSIIQPPQKTPDTGTKSSNNPYPGGTFALPDGSVIGVDADRNTHVISPPGKYTNILTQPDGSIIGLDSKGNKTVIAGPSSKAMSEYEQATVALQARKQAADVAADTAVQQARAVEDDIKKQLADSSITHDRMMELYQQGQQALETANQALTAQRDANNAWYQHQEAETARTGAETTRRQVEQTGQRQGEQTAIEAANALEANRSNLANERNQGAKTGADLLSQRASQATGLLNNWTNAAAGSKNFGLGGPIPGNMGASLMSDAQGFATQAMGGEDVMKTAAELVHAADPRLAGTKEGADYVATLAQMLERHKQQQGGQDTGQNADQTNTQANNQQVSNTAAAPAPQAPTVQNPNAPMGAPDRTVENRADQQELNPSSPDFMGKAIAAALGHVGSFRVAGQPDRAEANRGY